MLRVQSSSKALLAAIAVTLSCGISRGLGAEPTPLFYTVHKGRMYAQAGDADPTPHPNLPWFFGSVVDPMNSGLITNASVLAPAAAAQPLVWDAFSEMFSMNIYFQSQGALDAAFPPGQYWMQVAGALNQLAGISLPADAYPAPLRLANFPATQQMQADSDFLLSWTSDNPINSSDRIRLYIGDGQRHTVWAHRHNEYLPAQATSMTISSNTLRAGCSYTAVLMYIHAVWSLQAGTPRLRATAVITPRHCSI